MEKRGKTLAEQNRLAIQAHVARFRHFEIAKIPIFFTPSMIFVIDKKKKATYKLYYSFLLNGRHGFLKLISATDINIYLYYQVFRNY